MSRFLVAYASTEGQTRKIAEYLADTLRTRGHAVDCIDCASPSAGAFEPPPADAPSACHGVILAGSLHQGRYQTALLAFADRQRAWLRTLPCAFCSVSLSVLVDDPATRAELERAAREFCAQAGMEPVLTLQVAGALRFTQYDWFKRILSRLIAGRLGIRPGTAGDQEFTDWDQLQRFADRFAARVATPKPARD